MQWPQRRALPTPTAPPPTQLTPTRCLLAGPTAQPDPPEVSAKGFGHSTAGTLFILGGAAELLRQAAASRERGLQERRRAPTQSTATLVGYEAPSKLASAGAAHVHAANSIQGTAHFLFFFLRGARDPQGQPSTNTTDAGAPASRHLRTLTWVTVRLRANTIHRVALDINTLHRHVPGKGARGIMAILARSAPCRQSIQTHGPDPANGPIPAVQSRARTTDQQNKTNTPSLSIPPPPPPYALTGATF